MILHVDMDAFYASVEERERPELAGRPVVVGGSPEGRGVVAAANYVAREFGVRSAMSAAAAARLCPGAVFLPSRMRLYAEESRRIHDILVRYTPLIEPLSLDEAFLDVSGSVRLFGSAEAIARRIKDEIRSERSLVASVGVAPTKFVAKIASDVEKPDGLVTVREADVQSFLDPLPIRYIWGVGRVTGAALATAGVETIADLRRRDREYLETRFGQHGEQLWRLAHGLDPRPVSPDREAKSISHEVTFETDLAELEPARECVQDLVEQVMSRLRRAGRRARRVQLKIRFSSFRTVTRAATLPRVTDVTREVREAAERVLLENLAHPDPGGRLTHPVRLLGVAVAGLEGEAPRQTDLFAEPEHEDATRVDALVDRVRGRFGSTALRRGGRSPVTVGQAGGASPIPERDR